MQSRRLSDPRPLHTRPSSVHASHLPGSLPCSPAVPDHRTHLASEPSLEFLSTCWMLTMGLISSHRP